MDGAVSQVLVQTGKELFAFKLFLTSTHFLWVYDYFLTFGDEIKYAWSGTGSWIFVLFVANRYTPLLYLVWVNVTMFGYTESLYVSTPFIYCVPIANPHFVRRLDSCQETKWISVFHTVLVTFFAQIAVGLRVYAVTGKNKLMGGPLLVLTSAQLCFGVYFIIKSAISPAQPLPDISLDVFEICFYQRWRLGELLFTNLTIAFDLLAFFIIFAAAKRPETNKYSGIPTILDNIRRDATLYFIVMFVCQLLLEFFLLFAPENIQLMPGVVNTVFVPVMASRLMLSLKKAAAEPAVPWSLITMTNFGKGKTPEVGTIRFASWTLSGSQEISGTLSPSNEGDVELKSMPSNRG